MSPVRSYTTGREAVGHGEGEARPAIAVQDLSMAYRGRRGKEPVLALDRTTVDFGPREFVSLLGPSGCGKTTLLKIIGGLLQPSSGEVTVQGSTVQEAVRRRAFGFVFQSPTLLPWRTVADNARLLCEIMDHPGGERSHIEELLAKVGLSGFEDHYPRELSGGMQQRAGIVRALAFDPDILLMDEPFAAVDALTRDQLGEVLLDVWAGGRPVVFVTHSIEEAVFLSDRVVVMSRRPGRVFKEIPIAIPRPRQRETRDSAAFSDLKRRVREAVDRAQSGEGP